MFYGNLGGDKKATFMKALEDFKTMFRRVYANDNLITFNRNLTFFQDPKFVASFQKFAQNSQEKSLGWRIHTVCWAATQALSIPGDYVECGVWHGFSFAIATDFLEFEKVNKKLYLYDTYKGIPPEFNSENRNQTVYEREGDIYPEVCKRFSKYPNVKVVQGTVPESFAKECPDKIAFLHVDMNSSKSEIAALEALYDRVSVGGIILFDDFGWWGYDKQTDAEIAFMKQRGQMIMELPTGQGLMIKR